MWISQEGWACDCISCVCGARKAIQEARPVSAMASVVGRSIGGTSTISLWVSAMHCPAWCFSDGLCWGLRHSVWIHPAVPWVHEFLSLCGSDCSAFTVVKETLSRFPLSRFWWLAPGISSGLALRIHCFKCHLAEKWGGGKDRGNWFVAGFTLSESTG